MSVTTAFIGGGNMASSLVGGLLAASTEASTKASKILVAEPDENRRSYLQQAYAIDTTSNNEDVLACDIVVLAIKPQLMQQVCRQLQPQIGDNDPLYLSIAAGIKCEDIDRWLGGGRPIVRCMPNTPALLRAGASALYANACVSDEQQTQAAAIMQAVGIALWVDTEELLDAVTAVSGSGPAYFFLLMEAMQSAAVELGLDQATAQKLTLQTALGAARMACEGDIDAATLRQRVTSKGGTTEQAIDSFEKAGFRQIVKDALVAARNRSETLAQELGKDET